MNAQAKAKYHAKVAEWIKAAEEHEQNGDEDEVLWGVWPGEGSDEFPPPEALLPTKERAELYGELCWPGDWHVLPVLVDWMCRDNVDVPEPEAT